MKIWINKNDTTPEGYTWCKDVREAITFIQKTDLTIGRLNRAANTVQTEEEYDRCNKMVNSLHIDEINIANETVGSSEHQMLLMYIEELGRKDLYSVKTH